MIWIPYRIPLLTNILDRVGHAFISDLMRSAKKKSAGAGGRFSPNISFFLECAFLPSQLIQSVFQLFPLFVLPPCTSFHIVFFQTVISAPADCTVKRVAVVAGDMLSAGDLILVIA